MLVTKRAQILELTSEKPLAPHHFLGASTRNVMRVGRQGARVLGYTWLQCLPPQVIVQRGALKFCCSIEYYPNLVGFIWIDDVVVW